MARRVGMRLNRLCWRLSMSIGAEPLGPSNRADVETRAAEQIESLPEFRRQLCALGLVIADRL